MSKFTRKLLSNTQPIKDNPGIWNIAESLQNITAASAPVITAVYITDNTYTNLDDTAIGTSGGYIKLIGTGFAAGCTVYINAVAATTTTFVNSTEVRAVVSALTSGTYSLMIFNTNSRGAVWATGLIYSGFPTVTTSSFTSIGLITNTQLLATGDAPLTYSLQAGSTLPTGVTLSSSGLLSGTITGITVNTVYTFIILVNDAQLQTTQQTITLTVLVADLNFNSTVLALHGDANTFTADASTNKFEIVPTGTPSANIFNPLQPGYYSNSFNGTTDYLYAASFSPSLATATTPFTIEAWVNFTAFTGISIASSPYGGSGNIPFAIGMGTAGPGGTAGATPHLGYYTGAVWVTVVQSATSLVLNTWYHLAFVYTGSQATIYANGVSIGSAAYSTWYSSAPSTAGFYVGRRWDVSASTYFSGYISNFRFTNGIAVYTGAFSPPTAPLQVTQSAGTNIAAITSGVSLLTCQSTRFIDNSTNAYALTVNGTPKVAVQQPFTLPSPYTSYGSSYFNGTTDYLSVADNAALRMDSGDFTIEFWWSPVSIASFQTVLEKGYVSAGALLLQTGSGNGTIVVYAAGSAVITASSGSSVGTWDHYALVRSGTIMTLYRNGTSVGSATNSTNFNATASLFVGGSLGGGGYYVNGYISNARIVKGTALYTGGFTPSTPLTAVTGTSLLTLQTNQAPNNSQFRDSSTNNFMITRTGTPTQGTFTPFSQTGWSGYFNGNGDYFTVPSNTAFDQSGDFTIEAWIFLTSVPAEVSSVCPAIFAQDTSYFLKLAVNSSNQVVVNQSFVGRAITGSTVLSLNTWYHIALVRSGSASNNIKLYVNGTSVGQTTLTNMGASVNISYIGREPYTGIGSFYFPGYISNLRVVKGTALYTANFTPSTTPLTAISGTSLLTLQSNYFKDNSSNNFAITPAGTPSIQAFSPFAPAAAYSTGAVGGSVYFNGTTDYLTLPSAPLSTIASFTTEAWVYPTSTADATIFYILGNTTGYAGIRIVLGTSQVAILHSQNGTTWAVNSTNIGSVPINTWTHIAVTRNVNAGTLWVNGISIYTFTFGTLYSGTLNYIGVMNNSGTTAFFPGYISNLRVNNTTALYTANFTPPTAPLTAVTNTSLLLNATNAGIYDATAKNNLTTVGSAQVSTTQSKFGGSSMYFNGTSGYLLGIATPQLVFGAGNFTIEYWLYLNSTAQQGVFGMRPQSTNGVYPVMYFLSGTLRYNVSGTDRISASITTGTWYHVAVSRSGTSTKMFIDGTQAGSTYTDTSNYLCSTLVIGADEYTLGGTVLNGYIDDLRITKGIARYTANFTPSAYAFPDQ